MKNNLPEEKTMKWYFRLILIVLLTAIYKPITYPIIKFFVSHGILPNSYAFGIVYWIVLGILYFFMVYKIWKLKK